MHVGSSAPSQVFIQGPPDLKQKQHEEEHIIHFVTRLYTAEVNAAVLLTWLDRFYYLVSGSASSGFRAMASVAFYRLSTLLDLKVITKMDKWFSKHAHSAEAVCWRFVVPEAFGDLSFNYLQNFTLAILGRFYSQLLVLEDRGAWRIGSYRFLRWMLSNSLECKKKKKYKLEKQELKNALLSFDVAGW